MTVLSFLDSKILCKSSALSDVNITTVPSSVDVISQPSDLLHSYETAYMFLFFFSNKDILTSHIKKCTCADNNMKDSVVLCMLTLTNATLQPVLILL